ncbi:hypothetical protein KR074_011151, partial [Drosophila pseudoananassae]
MLLLHKAILWILLAGAGPNWNLLTSASRQVQVKIPVKDVHGIFSGITGFMNGRPNNQRRKERPYKEQYWPQSYEYYDPYQSMYWPPYYLYSPYEYPWPNEPTTKPPTKPPTETTTEPPTNPTTTEAPTETTTLPITTEPATEATTTVATTTDSNSETTTAASVVTTEAPTESPTTEASTTEETPESTTTPPARDLCSIYHYLPECQESKWASVKKNALKVKKQPTPNNVLQTEQNLSVETMPHSMTSLCFYYPRLCMRPEEAQFVRLSDANGRPLLLISPLEGKSP